MNKIFVIAMIVFMSIGVWASSDYQGLCDQPVMCQPNETE